MNKDNLQEISDGIKDIFSTQFTFDVECSKVPHYNDAGFTFESGQTKKGKTIETCVLYVDIRNSVALNRNNTKETMGKLYTSFIKSVLWCADYHGGSVRNIIGDRVMIVFPPKNCFTTAVDCAVSINTVTNRIMPKRFKDFKCGIGIDYGEMYVLKTGIIKQGQDTTTYKELVWIGRPANIASRLTDIANKEERRTVYSVRRNPIIVYAIHPWLKGLSLLHQRGITSSTDKEPLYLNTVETVDLSSDEFANSISQYSSGELYMTGGKVLNFERKEIKSTAKAILMTEDVFKGFVAANPNRDSVKNKYWKEASLKIKDYSKKIYEGDVNWASIDEVKY